MESVRINLFTHGDCRDFNTWSNLPFYLYHALRERALVTPLNLVSLGTPRHRLWTGIMDARDRTVGVFRPGFARRNIRNRSYHRLVNKQLEQSLRAHQEVDFNLFLTFSFSSHGYADVPVVHYCDRTYEHHLEDTGKTPSRNDQRFIAVDRNNIENADLVFTTNEPCREFIQSRYRPKRVVHLSAGINSNVERVDPDHLIASKQDSRDILFIGRGFARRGVDVLIPAFKLVNERHGGRYALHLVGIEEDEVPRGLRQVAGVRYHGYLDRKDPVDLERYNDLLGSARMIVCPMRPGPFPGAVREAMWHCTPVVISDVSWELVTRTGAGLVARSMDPAAFAREMETLIHDRTLWTRMARAAHAAVKEMTWARAVEQLLSEVEACGLVGRRRSSDALCIRTAEGVGLEHIQ